MKREILIDCDPGVDDTIALLMAFNHPKTKVVALTTVFGNQHIDITTKNALILKDYFGFEVEVSKGTAAPIFHERKYQSSVHGSNGLGNIEFPEPTSTMTSKYAWDVMYEEAKKRDKSLTIVTLGPLSNLAIAILKYEDLVNYVKEIIIMGGAKTIGNAKPFGEANVVDDPYAMQVVLNSKIPVTMVGLNATETTRMTEAQHESIFGNGKQIDERIVKMLAQYKAVLNKAGSAGLVIHDAAAMAVVLYPEWTTSAMYPVEVETAVNSMNGRTIVDIRKHSKAPRNCKVIESIDRARYLELLDKTLKGTLNGH